MTYGNPKPEQGESDPAMIERLLEIELQQKRAAWQQAKAHRGTLRAFSFLFLGLIVAGAALCFFLYFSTGKVNEANSKTARGEDSPATEATP